MRVTGQKTYKFYLLDHELSQQNAPIKRPRKCLSPGVTAFQLTSAPRLHAADAKHCVSRVALSVRPLSCLNEAINSHLHNQEQGLKPPKAIIYFRQITLLFLILGLK